MTTNPTFLGAFSSLDFGSIQSADGREHPVVATTPIYTTGQQQPTATDPTSGVDVNASLGSFFPSFSLWPQHFTARVVVGIIAVIILAIVVVRITL